MSDILLLSVKGEPALKMLKESGHSVEHRPLLGFKDIDCEGSHILKKDYDAAICVSRYAADCFLNRFAKNERAGPKYFSCVFTPGESTADPFHKAGYTTAYPRTRTGSEALLALDSFKKIDSGKVLVICGKDGRTLLVEELQSRGVDVYTLILYEVTQSMYPCNMWKKEFNIVWASSGHILDSFKKNMHACDQTWNQKSTLILPSARLAEKSIQMGLKWSKIIVLDNAYIKTFVEYIQEKF